MESDWDWMNSNTTHDGPAEMKEERLLKTGESLVDFELSLGMSPCE
jgi:hypothetical protein